MVNGNYFAQKTYALEDKLREMEDRFDNDTRLLKEKTLAIQHLSDMVRNRDSEIESLNEKIYECDVVYDAALNTM